MSASGLFSSSSAFFTSPEFLALEDTDLSLSAAPFFDRLDLPSIFDLRTSFVASLLASLVINSWIVNTFDRKCCSREPWSHIKEWLKKLCRCSGSESCWCSWPSLALPGFWCRLSLLLLVLQVILTLISSHCASGWYHKWKPAISVFRKKIGIFPTPGTGSFAIPPFDQNFPKYLDLSINVMKYITLMWEFFLQNSKWGTLLKCQHHHNQFTLFISQVLGQVQTSFPARKR